MKTALTDEQVSEPLQTLLALPLPERIGAVAKDLRSGKDRFRQINPHRLAEALGVPDSRRPSDLNWSFTNYACKQSLEEYSDGSDAISDLVCLIEDKVSAERFEALVKKSADLQDYCGAAQFEFLTAKERWLLEEAIALKQLESNMENGICCIAQYSIPVSKREDLDFEAVIEDDGACITLRTPYDKRDGKFLDLDDCVTQGSW